MARGTDARGRCMIFSRGKNTQNPSIGMDNRVSLFFRSDMSDIVYHHERNLHSLVGALRGLPYLLGQRKITSLLDVGAGNGNWLYAAQQAGIRDILGVDGVIRDPSCLCVESEFIKPVDLRKPLDIGRRFDAALCLEVAEHLPQECANILIGTLCKHSDLIFFSAAAPFQNGEQHLNCQSPEYWQQLFNKQGYVCVDDIRMRMWNDTAIEPWYRQNVFIAVHDPAQAGSEPRVLHIIHPEMIEVMDFPNSPMAKSYVNLERGIFHPLYYFNLLSVSIMRRFQRLFKRRMTR